MILVTVLVSVALLAQSWYWYRSQYWHLLWYQHWSYHTKIESSGMKHMGVTGFLVCHIVRSISIGISHSIGISLRIDISLSIGTSCGIVLVSVLKLPCKI